MQLQEKIIDYIENKEEIDKWLALKGEAKYLEFASLLELYSVPIYWNSLNNIYRYDKRLLINIFKYMSFFEEFLRAQIWNMSEIAYSNLESAYLRETIDKVIELKDKTDFREFSIDTLIKYRDSIKYLRNRISHNKIMLTSKLDDKNLEDLIIAFKITLPESYRKGFSADINDCKKGLVIPQQLAITL